MAAGTKLSITFTSADGTFTQSYGYVDEDAENSDLQTVANTIVTNGVILSKIPTGVKSMKLITTTEKDVPIS